MRRLLVALGVSILLTTDCSVNSAEKIKVKKNFFQKALFKHQKKKINRGVLNLIKRKSLKNVLGKKNLMDLKKSFQVGKVKNEAVEVIIDGKIRKLISPAKILQEINHNKKVVDSKIGRFKAYSLLYNTLSKTKKNLLLSPGMLIRSDVHRLDQNYEKLDDLLEEVPDHLILTSIYPENYVPNCSDEIGFAPPLLQGFEPADNSRRCMPTQYAVDGLYRKKDFPLKF